MKLQKVFISLAILIIFYVSTHASGWLKVVISPNGFSSYLPYIIWTFTIAAFWPAYKSRLFSIIGLHSSLFKGVGLACLFVLPMVLGFALTSKVSGFDPILLIKKALLPGFFEELMFRGFLVGMLISVANWRFLPAACVNALLFGIGHWFQGSTPTQALIASLFTAIGGLWFAWLFVAWQRNLWLVASLHALMNACWVVWQVDNTAIGGQLANVLRLSTIALSILVTIVVKRKDRSLNNH